MKVDIFDLQHIDYLLNYCGAHSKSCNICSIIEFCKKLEVKILHKIKYPNENLNTTEEDLLIILNLRQYCYDCNKCTCKCTRKVECERLMWKIVDDHKDLKEINNGRKNFKR